MIKIIAMNGNLGVLKTARNLIFEHITLSVESDMEDTHEIYP